MLLFIDTNIIVDLLAARTPFLRDAAQLFTLADTGKVKLFTSSIAVTTTFYSPSKGNETGSGSSGPSKTLDHGEGG